MFFTPQIGIMVSVYSLYSVLLDSEYLMHDNLAIMRRADT